jgi:uncharacterized protein
MPSYGRAGVYITEQLAGVTPTPSTTNPSTAGFIGEHWRGPTTAQRITSWAQFVQVFGGFNTSTTPTLNNVYLPFAVYEFFVNGGQACWVARITGSSTPGTSASTTLLDSAATPQATLRLTAGSMGVVGNVGTWGNSMYASVANRGGASSGRFDLTLFYGGTTGQYIVETWIDLSMNPMDARYALSVLNSPISGSQWVVATNQNSPTTPPNNAPAVVSTQQFSGGTDCSSPSTTDRSTAVTFGSSPFDIVPGVLNINMPGETTTSVLGSAITYAQTRPATFLVLDPPSGLTPAGAVSYLQSLAPVSSYAALYYPWLYASDPSSTALNSVRLLPPGGFILGQIANTDTQVGPWKAPAGINTRLNVVQAERTFAPSDLDTLNSNNVDALRTLASGGVVIWGARTMQTGYATLYVPVRRTLNYIENSLVQTLQFAIFQPNNPVLWGQIASTVNQFLGGLFNAGAFAGSSPATSFYVTCDATNNTPQTISQGIVNVQVGLALVSPAEFISILITQYQSSGTTTVTQL